MSPAHRLDLADMVRQFGGRREVVTVAECFAAYPFPLQRRDITAALRAAGYVYGFTATGRRREDLLLYENWLHAEVRAWCEGRAHLTLAQFAADHPEMPHCAATRREIAGALARLGYARAYVRMAS